MYILILSGIIQSANKLGASKEVEIGNLQDNTQGLPNTVYNK